jgi:UDP-N-acetylmuramate--alanine ligase
MSFLKDNSFYFIGIGGVGMSSLAQILCAEKKQVFGSDMQQNAHTQFLKELGCEIGFDQTEKNVPQSCVVVYNSLIQKTHPQMQDAIQKQLKVMHRSDLLNLIVQEYESYLVTGSSGKTSTSCLLTFVLLFANKSPSFCLGGQMIGIKQHGQLGSGPFIAEADESDGSIIKYRPKGAIITNVSSDHLDFYKTKKNIQKAFHTFLNNVQDVSYCFYCGDDPFLKKVGKGTSFGWGTENQICALNYTQDCHYCSFDIQMNGQLFKDFKLSMMGEHMVCNALGVFGLCLKLGLEVDTIKRAFLAFKGVKKRQEVTFDSKSLTFFDDYGHFPKEIECTLKAIRTFAKNRRIVCVFEPHKYTRLKEHLDDFANSFDLVDELFITQVYPSGTKKNGVDHLTLIDKLNAKFPRKARYLPLEKSVDLLSNYLRPFDCLITFAAGDSTKIHPPLKAYFEKKDPKKYSLALFYGARSAEHEITKLSKANISKGLNRHFFDVAEIYVDKNNSLPSFEQLKQFDIMFPVFHSFGEDGTFQGLFEILGTPYCGCGVKSSAIAMDKVTTKILASVAGILTAKWITFFQEEWSRDKQALIKKIEHTFEYPFIVKANHLGSSIGTSLIRSLQELLIHMDLVFQCDHQAIVEEYIQGREFEFSVIGDDPYQVAGPGEILTNGKIYDYESKYMNDSIKTTPKAILEDQLINTGQALALRAYKAVGCNGFARVDFLFKDNLFYLMEINPIPGFTSISLFPKMFEEKGVGLEALLNKIVQIALKRHRQQNNAKVLF